MLLVYKVKNDDEVASHCLTTDEHNELCDYDLAELLNVVIDSNDQPEETRSTIQNIVHEKYNLLSSERLDLDDDFIVELTDIIIMNMSEHDKVVTVYKLYSQVHDQFGDIESGYYFTVNPIIN